jgi:GDPmannose 4,6-dehydratase
MEVEFHGSGIDEVATEARTGRTLVRINGKFHRPAEVDLLIGDPAKAQQTLSWKAETTLEQLCSMMVDADLRRNRNGATF